MCEQDSSVGSRHTHTGTLICMFVCRFVLSASLFIFQLVVVFVVVVSAVLLLLAVSFSFSSLLLCAMRFVFVVAARLSFCLRFGRRPCVLLLLLFCFLRDLFLSVSVSPSLLALP